MRTPLSQLLASADVSADGNLSVLVPEDWMQGRSLFGGLQVALALRAMRALIPRAPLRALQATFVAPVGAKVELTAAILRRGKSVTHVEAQIAEGARTALLVVGIFGEARSSSFSVRRARGDDPGGVDVPFPHVAGVTPSFLQHFDARLRKGALLFSGSGSSHAIFDIDLHDDGPTTEAHAIAISDLVPPLGLTYLSTPAPGSTATWLLELMVDRFDDLLLAGWRVEASLDAARDGYTSQSTVVWAPDGTTVAHGRQTMMVFG
jgi:acyl-coenzyme A thioesterase PaaI-like protein